ncbi:MAG TPA: SH3 domain-containing protein, partial [Terriglobales bacterium]|nr:SH3 domain-containing protein [Terriglobales bacterium]
MKHSLPPTSLGPCAKLRVVGLVIFVLALLLTPACKRGGKFAGKEYVYVSAPQANLRDRLSAVYNKVGTVKNGDRLEVLEKSKRFYRVRAEGVGEGWIEQRYLADQDIYDGFLTLSRDNANSAFQARGATRAELNMHLTPARDGDHLYQLKEGEKVEILRRTVTDKNAKAIESYRQEVQKLQQQIQAAQAAATTGAGAAAEVKDTAAKQPASAKSAVPGVKPNSPKPPDAAAAQLKLAKMPEPPASILEDWSLVRDSQKHVGWVLARMIDIDVPIEIAQYAEGQRIVANFVLNTVTDVSDTGETRQVPQFLVLTT